MFDVFSSESIQHHGTEVPVFNILYLSNKGVLSAKRVAIYHVKQDRKLAYGHQVTVASDIAPAAGEYPTFISLRTDRVIDVFDTHAEAVLAFERADSLYADQIRQIKSDPGYHGRKLPPKDYSFKVCFTGFAKTDRAELTALAEAAGMKVVTGVPASLDFLCCGDNAGWAKMKKANEVGVPLVSHGQIRLLIDTGELPESYAEAR